MKKQRVFVIGGPTASGKSGLAIQLAQEIDGCIVNGDAIQVYQDLQVLSARPSAEDIKKVPHYLFGHVDAWTNYSLADWLNEVAPVIPNLKNPIVVGGTGMYLDALVNGVHAIPDIDPEIRKKVRQMSLEEVRSQMKDYPFQDPQRLRRALEVRLSTGHDLMYYYERPKRKIIDSKIILIHILPEREKVYESCAKRFDIMKKMGAINEVAHLNKIKASGGVLKAIGVPEIKEFLSGRLSESEMTNKVVIATRQYAKRQMTWFRHHGTPQYVIEDPLNVKIKEITK